MPSDGCLRLRVFRRKMASPATVKAAAQDRPRARWPHRAAWPNAPPTANCMGPKQGDHSRMDLLAIELPSGFCRKVSISEPMMIRKKPSRSPLTRTPSSRPRAP